MNFSGLNITAMVAIPFVLVALFLIYRALAGRRKVSAAKSWPTAPGQVVMSHVETRRSSNGNGGRTTSYYPAVVYVYQVNGQSFQGSRFNFGAVGRGNYRAVEQKVAQYPPGRMIQVYYNPANPADAVLEPNAPASGWLLLVAAIIIIILIATVGFSTLMTGMMGSFLPK